MADTVRLPEAQQARSKRTRRALIDAGLEILADQGPNGLTIEAVSGRAGLAAGTVYRRFGGKDGLISVLQHEFTTDFRTEFTDRMTRAGQSGTDLTSAVDAAVSALTDTFASHETLMRVFSLMGLQNPALFEEGQRASQAGGREFRAQLLPYSGDFGGTDSELVIDSAHRIVYAACMHRVLHGPNLESPTQFSWGDLSRELSRAVLAYLRSA